jgi:general secretion pathway protein K
MSIRTIVLPLRATGQRGFVIVPVLWILMMLATLVGVLSVYLARSAVALAVNDDRLRVDALVTAGLELTAYTLSSAAKQTRAQNGSFSFELDRSRVSVRFATEAARVDLNVAPKPMLANLFRVLGADPRDADQYADRVVGWRAPQRDTLDAENALYRAAGAPYLPRGGAFASVDELWLVLGIPAGLVDLAMPFITVFSGQSEISVLDAAPEVIAALPGMTPAIYEQFLKQRAILPRDDKAIADALGEARKSAKSQGGATIRVVTEIQLDNGRRALNEAVILLESGDSPYKILSWRDDAEVSSLRKPPGGRLL